jgi:hypothetical protein
MERLVDRGAYAVGLAALMAVLAMPGCGGSGGTETLSKAEVVKQASTICRDAQKERERAVSEATKGVEPPTVHLVTDTILPTVQKMAKELAHLKASASENKEVQAIASAMNSAARKVAANAKGSTLQEDAAAFSHANQLAEEYGLTDCRI